MARNSRISLLFRKAAERIARTVKAKYNADNGQKRKRYNDRINNSVVKTAAEKIKKAAKEEKKQIGNKNKLTSVADTMRSNAERSAQINKVKNAGLINKINKSKTSDSDSGLTAREKALKHNVQKAVLNVGNRVGKGYAEDLRSGIYTSKATNKEKQNVAKSIEKDYNKKAKSTRSKIIAGFTRSDTNIKAATKGVTGKEIDTSKVTKTKAYKGGDIAQELTSYAIAPTSAVEKGLAKAAAKSLLKKEGKKVTKDTLAKAVKIVAKNKKRSFVRGRAADVLANAPLNAKYAADRAKDEKTGKLNKKKFGKEVAMYATFDAGIGAGIAGIKGGKALKAAKQTSREARANKMLDSRIQKIVKANKKADTETKKVVPKKAKRAVNSKITSTRELNFGKAVEKEYEGINTRLRKGVISNREAKKQRKALADVVERRTGRTGVRLKGGYGEVTKTGLNNIDDNVGGRALNFDKRFRKSDAKSIGIRRIRERMAEQPKATKINLGDSAKSSNVDVLINKSVKRKVSENLRKRSARSEARSEKAYESIRARVEEKKQALAKAKEAENAKAFEDKYTIGTKARKKVANAKETVTARTTSSGEGKQVKKTHEYKVTKTEPDRSITTRRLRNSKDIRFGNTVQKYLNDIDERAAKGKITTTEARRQKKALAETIGNRELVATSESRAKGKIKRLKESVEEAPTKSRSELEAERKELVDELWQKSTNKKTKYNSKFDKARGDQKYKEEIDGINKRIASIDKDLSYYKSHPEPAKEVKAEPTTEPKETTTETPKAETTTETPKVEEPKAEEQRSGFENIEDMFEEEQRTIKESEESAEKSFEKNVADEKAEKAVEGANEDKGRHTGDMDDTQTEADDELMGLVNEATNRDARIYKPGEVDIPEAANAKIDAATERKNAIEQARENYFNAEEEGYKVSEREAKRAEKGVKNEQGTGRSEGESDIRGTSEELSERSSADRAGVEGESVSEEHGATQGDSGSVLLNEQQRARLDASGVANTGVRETDHATFSNAINKEKGTNSYGGYVDSKSVEELENSGAKAFLTDDGKAGIVVTKDGDIEALFRGNDSKHRGVLDDLLITARANGGSKMDCFGKPLVNKYERCGYVPVARVKFNAEYVDDPILLQNQPDVYVLMKNTDDLNTVIDKNISNEYHLSTQEELDKLPEMDYDEALNYRNRLLSAQETGGKGGDSTVLENIGKAVKPSGKAKINSAFTSINRILNNSLGFSEKQAEIYARRNGDQAFLGTFRGNANNLRQALQRASHSFLDEQIDYNARKVGDSAKTILKDIQSKGTAHYNDVQSYLYLLNHADRLDSASSLKMGELIQEYQKVEHELEIGKITEEHADKLLTKLSEKMDTLESEGIMGISAEGGNKRLFNNLTADEARLKAEEILRRNPEVAEDANKIVRYFRNDLRSQVQSGLISKDTLRYYIKTYPNYVPAHRQPFGANRIGGADGTKVNLKATRAKGSGLKLLPIEDQMKMSAEYTFTKGAQNDLSKSIAKMSGYHPDVLDMYNEQDAISALDLATFYDIDKGTLQFFDDGKLVTLHDVDKQFLKDIKDQHISGTEWEGLNSVLDGMGSANRLFKSLITSYSPAFMIKNFFRDFPEGAFQSQDTRRYLGNLLTGRGARSILANDDYYRAYKRLGGKHSQFINSAEEVFKDDNWAKLNPLKKIEALNEFTEQIPRMTEFISFLEKRGKNAQTATADELRQAAEAAADVTVNFGRSGSAGRIINKSFIPFFNPAIQGTSKVIRTIKRDPTVAGYMKLLSKGALLGVAPTAVNEWLLRDNENYQLINERDRATNYYIPLSADNAINKYLFGSKKIGAKDGEIFFKLPKARFLSVLGMGTQKAMKTTDIPYAEIWRISKNQIGPVGLDNNIFRQAKNSALFDDKSKGKTWYGADIESAYEKGSPKNHYDENTSGIAIKLGQITGRSPKKIDYLIDSYTGVVGDIAIPWSRKASNRGYIAKAFSTDTVSQNNLTTKLFNRIDELAVKKDDGDTSKAVDYGHYYLENRRNKAGDIRDKIKKIQMSNKSHAEKAKEIRPLQRELNKTTKVGLDTEKSFVKAAKKYVSRLDGTDLKATTKRQYGLENAMIATAKERGEDPWEIVEKAFKRSDNRVNVAKYAKGAGLDPVTFKEFYNLHEYDLDKNGYPAKAEVISYLNGRDDLTREEKAILFAGVNKNYSKYGNPFGSVGGSRTGSGGRSGGRRRRSGRSGGRSGGSKATSNGKAIGATGTTVKPSTTKQTSVADVMKSSNNKSATATALAKILKSSTAADYEAAARSAIRKKSSNKNIYQIKAKKV